MTGILLLDKPCGLSSNAALQRVRRLYGGAKAGHAGSLDPLATGMLPICLGEATKVAGEMLAGRKRYRFTLALGASTTTADAGGEVTRTAPVPALAAADVRRVLARFTGTLRQVPPMYSALKLAGQPLYRLARAGVTVERRARTIEVSELTLVAQEAAHLELEALCSKGTYVRTLGEDIAAALGTAGHLSALRRLYVEPFEGETMHALDSLEEACAAGSLPALLPADRALQALPAVRLSDEQKRRLTHGQLVPFTDEVTKPAPAGPRVRLYDAQGRFLGLGEICAGTLRPRRLLKVGMEA